VKAVADYYPLHRNLRLDFIHGKPKKAVVHLVSLIRPATSKTLVESKLETDKSELKKDFLEFITHLEQLAIIRDEHCHVVEHKKTGDSGMKNSAKSSDAGSRSSGHNYGESSHGGASNKASNRDRTKSGHERSLESTATGKQSAREPPPCLNTKKYAGEKHYVSNCPRIRVDGAIVLLSEDKKKRDADKKKANFKSLGNNRATSENRDGQTAYLMAENLWVKVTVLADTGSDYSAIPRSKCFGGRKEAWLPSQGRGVAGAHHAEHGYQERKRQAEVQRKRDAHVSGDNHYAVGASVHAWSACSAARTNVVFTNSYVDNNSSLVGE
jgi:hypothetical protein